MPKLTTRYNLVLVCRCTCSIYFVRKAMLPDTGFRHFSGFNINNSHRQDPWIKFGSCNSIGGLRVSVLWCACVCIARFKYPFACLVITKS